MNEPPLVLVRTWYELLVQTKEPEAAARAQEMLLSAFGDEHAVAAYLKKHNIID